ncbi:hypothetical protein [Oscillatoria sp. FACHB-1406]|uniref:hypothetical protein n=1 Tax=Oscillatoria sp. FACHB-1406 TaxID=2692846 RepID=UPI001687368B|nr:hypothetical protein [Oscillatoria sp. FACHB-1406]MBD2579332.1 hypothetical protein [Oscillatoria sp. FACHB-1406]
MTAKVKMLPSSSDTPLEKLTDSQEQRMQVQRKRDILLLIEHLIYSQETTVKMILDALYDVGAVNWIDVRFQAHPVNRTMKSIARLSKPAFRMLALRWFKQNCPQLIVNWLYSQVQFKPEKLPKKIEQTLTEKPGEHSKLLVVRDREVKELRSQVRLLTGTLVAAIALLGGTSFWLGYNLQLVQTQQVSAPLTKTSVSSDR